MARQQMIFISDDNNIPTASYDDFFKLNMYEGDIYKTRNLKNQSMAQMYPDADELRKAQDSIQARLTNFENKLWVPDREDIIGQPKNKKDKNNTEIAAVDNDNNDNEAQLDESEATENQPKRSTKRSTKRSSKNKKPKQIKEPKSNKSSSATRSVRRRK